MIEKFNIIVIQGEDGYLISEVIEFPGCHTQAKTYDELMERTEKAISLYMVVKATDLEMPKCLSLQRHKV